MSKNGTLFIVFLIVATVIVVFYFSSWQNTDNSDVNTDGTDKNANVNTNTSASANSNINLNSNSNINSTEAQGGDLSDGFGFTLNGFSGLPEAQGTMTSFDLGDGNTLVVMSLDDEGMVRNSYGATTEEEVVVSGEPAKLITGSSAKDGSKVKIVLMEYNEKLLFFKGSTDFLNNLSNVIEFTN